MPAPDVAVAMVTCSAVRLLVQMFVARTPSLVQENVAPHAQVVIVIFHAAERAFMIKV